MATGGRFLAAAHSPFWFVSCHQVGVGLFYVLFVWFVMATNQRTNGKDGMERQTEWGERHFRRLELVIDNTSGWRRICLSSAENLITLKAQSSRCTGWTAGFVSNKTYVRLVCKRNFMSLITKNFTLRYQLFPLWNFAKPKQEIQIHLSPSCGY